MQQHTCKNCFTDYQGNYCNICGQQPAERLDLHHIGHQLIHVFTHTDKGIIPFIPNIITRPGTIAMEYIEGKRKKYFNLFQYLILVVGFSIFLMARTHYMQKVLAVANRSIISDPNNTTKGLAVQKELVGFIQQYQNVFLFLSIPLYAFFSWLTFRKRGYNYAEHIVLQSAIQAQQNTILLFTLIPIAYFISSDNIPAWTFYLPVLLLISCSGIAIRQFFQVSWFKAIWKSLLVYLLSYIVQMIIMGTIAVIIIMMKKH